MNPWQNVARQIAEHIEHVRRLDAQFALVLTCNVHDCNAQATHRLRCTACGRHGGVVCDAHADLLNTTPTGRDLVCGATAQGAEIFRLEAL